MIVTIHWRNTVLKPPAFFWVTTQGGEINNPLLEDHHGDSGHEIGPFFWVDLITTEAVVLPKPNALSWFNLGKSSPFMAEFCRLVTYYNWLVVWNIGLFFHILGIIIPTDFHIFQRGRNHQPVMMYPDYLCCDASYCSCTCMVILPEPPVFRLYQFYQLILSMLLQLRPETPDIDGENNGGKWCYNSHLWGDLLIYNIL